MKKCKEIWGKFWSAVKSHKKSSIAIGLILLAGIGFFIYRTVSKKDTQTAATGGVRTVTLQKGTLYNSITATGTVESAEVSSVSTQLSYSVASVAVAVGDQVKKGDVICTLDTTDLEKEITKAKSALTDTQTAAQSAYDKAVAKKTAASTQLTSDTAAQAALVQDAYNAYAATAPKVTSAQSALSTAQSNLASARSAAGLDTLEQNYTSAQNDANSALEAWKRAAASGSGDVTALEAAYNTANQKATAAKEALEAVRTSRGIAALEQAVTNAQSALSQAQQNQSAALSAYQSALSLQAKTLAADNDSVSSTTEAVETAATQVTKAATSDELTSLQEKLAQCTITAATGGKVTSLSATVGAKASDTLAEIQSTDHLKVSVAVSESDISKVQVGMRAIVTSDATGDTEIAGTVTSVSPVAASSQGGMTSSDVTFAVEVEITTENTGLLVGMNAKVQIVVEEKDDIYSVPLDAVGQQGQNSVIYVRGDDGTFSAVTVTTGLTTDYYTEISGDTLKDGMVVRASASASEAQVGDIAMESSSSSQDNTTGIFGMGGTQGSQGTQQSGQMGGGGGQMPSGGGPGGNGGQ